MGSKTGPRQGQYGKERMEKYSAGWDAWQQSQKTKSRYAEILTKPEPDELPDEPGWDFGFLSNALVAVGGVFILVTVFFFLVWLLATFFPAPGIPTG